MYTKVKTKRCTPLDIYIHAPLNLMYILCKGEKVKRVDDQSQSARMPVRS